MSKRRGSNLKQLTNLEKAKLNSYPLGHGDIRRHLNHIQDVEFMYELGNKHGKKAEKVISKFKNIAEANQRNNIYNANSATPSPKIPIPSLMFPSRLM